MSNQVSIKTIQARMSEGVPLGKFDEQIGKRLWWAALDILQNEILIPLNLKKGVWLASPLPVLYDSKILSKFQGWVWAPEGIPFFNSSNIGLLPPTNLRSADSFNYKTSRCFKTLHLRESDGFDPFLIIITKEAQIALALEGKPGKRQLLMRSDPETLTELLTILDQRLNIEKPEDAEEIRKYIADLGPLKSNNNIAKNFWPLLATRLACIAPSLHIQTYQDTKYTKNQKDNFREEIPLLEALTHEIRTPLSTIRTLIRSILKRDDLSDTVLSRLKQIDSECTEQIDRFGLIFNAVELERDQTFNSGLAKTDLGNVLEILFVVWEKQLERRGIKLTLDITPNLPPVLSNPERLELMLGGLIDRNTRGIQSGGNLLLELLPAGQKVKLKITSNFSHTFISEELNTGDITKTSDLGTVLSWNPNTGSLQLTKAATERLLASLGGRLISRKDRGITIFFPTAESF